MENESLDRLGKKLVEQLKQGIVERKLVASGNLLNSISYEIKDGSLVINAADYIYTLVKGGRKPGGNPLSFFREILRWVEKKPSVVPSDMTPSDFAAATAVTIARSGNLMFRQGSTPNNDGRLLEFLNDNSIYDSLANELTDKLFDKIDIKN